MKCHLAFALRFSGCALATPDGGSPAFGADVSPASNVAYVKHLTKFHHEFVAKAKRDPTGFNTLKRVLGEDDMAAFQKKWEKFVLAFRESEDW